MNKTLAQLAELLRQRNIRCALLPADPPDVPADGLNVWPKLDPQARYPFTTIYAPTAGAPSGTQNSDFVWGPNFEHRKADITPVEALMFSLVLTLPDYAP